MPWRRVQRCYPPVPEEAFVASMEKGLDLYSRSYNVRYPAICRDEHAQPLRADTRPGRPATYDYEYARHDTCTVWLFVKPLGPWRTARPWTGLHQVQTLVNHLRYRLGRAPDLGL